MIKLYFIEHKVLEIFLAKRVLFEVEIKGAHGLCRRLVVWEVQLLQVWMR